MRTLGRRFCVVMSMLSVASFAQTPAQIQAYLAQQPQNTGSMSSIAEALKSRPTSGDLRPAESVAAATIATTGDSGFKVETRSVYEQILNRSFPTPDSMIPYLKPFGYEIFAQSRTLNFAPSTQLSVPAGYMIGPGDEIAVSLWGRLNESYRLSVNRDGNITLPHIGQVQVAGMPFSAMEEAILDKCKSIAGVEATVTMGVLRSIQVYVVGDVKTSGQYTVSALTTVLNALFAAGGPNSRGSLRKIQVRRGGGLVATVDIYDLLMNGTLNSTVRLKDGDVVFVPMVQKMAGIAGNVRRSALYELKEKTTLKEFVQLAGGFTPAAWVNRIQVERFTNNQYQTVLDLSAQSSDNLPTLEIQDADIVKIFPIVVQDKDAVYLSGNVKRPGKYQFTTAMKIADLITGYEGLRTESYFDYAVVKRQQPPLFNTAIVPFSLKNALDNAGSTDNLELEARDEVIIFHRDFFQPDQKVTIDGAVNKPGDQKALSNMTIRDLIIQAGGLRDDASTERGELYRRVSQGDSTVIIELPFSVDKAMANDASENKVLERADRVYIRKKTGWQDLKRIVLKGEVVFPGEYVVMGNETLRDVIQRAGGFTADAYIEASVFIRASVKVLEKKRIDEYTRQLEQDILRISGELAANDKSAEAQAMLTQQMALLEKLRNVAPIGRVVIDMTNEAHYQHFFLEDNDSLIIPRTMSTVTVLGEVFNPATFNLDYSHAQVRHYLEMSGGSKQYADKGNLYVIKANGSVVTKKMTNVKNYKLSPGDAVVMPQQVKFTNNFKTVIEAVGAVGTSAYTIQMLISLAATLSK